MINLIKHIESVRLLRSWDIPPSLHNVCCIAMQEDIHLLSTLICNNPELKIRLLLVPDLPDNAPKQLHLPTSRGISIIPVSNLQVANAVPQWEKVILCRPGPLGAAGVERICRYLTGYGVRTVYLYAGHSPGFGMQTALPDFYRQHAAKLDEVYELLGDEASHEVYAARIKALLTGNAGYFPLSLHQEYYHPLIHPAYGDIMLDGGVSDMVGAQVQFARSVGTAGHIFGFEPIPSMAAVARNTLAAFPQYHLQTAGLGESRGRLRFKFLRDSSHISMNSDNDSVLCDMTSIDEFVEEHHLSHVDCIKCDVEGAELLALAGGKKTILEHNPKLIICLYHIPSHLTDIPLFIHSLVPEYAMYISHSSCLFTDTILYAHIPHS